jgi:hypothetical protein
MAPNSREADLNLLLASYLGFGRQARKTIDELTTEELGPIDEDYRRWLVETVSAARSQVSKYVADHCVNGHWDRRLDRAEDEWVAAQFPWMTKRNRKRTIAYGWWGTLF